jgi:hypothetical protein
MTEMRTCGADATLHREDGWCWFFRAIGVTLDGRVKSHDGQPRDFKLNLDLLPGWTSTLRLWRLLP